MYISICVIWKYVCDVLELFVGRYLFIFLGIFCNVFLGKDIVFLYSSGRTRSTSQTFTFYCIVFVTHLTEFLFLLFVQCMEEVPYIFIFLLFLYCMWLVSRGILLLLLPTLCVLHIRKSWFAGSWLSHFAPCRIRFLLLLHCMQITLWEFRFAE